MEKYLIKGGTLTAIADKIRQKSVSDSKYIIANDYVKNDSELKNNILTVSYREYIDWGGEYEGKEPTTEFNNCSWIYKYEKNNVGQVVPMLMKKDSVGIDYLETYYYAGVTQVSGVTYDRWRKIEAKGLNWDSLPKIYILTN